MEIKDMRSAQIRIPSGNTVSRRAKKKAPETEDSVVIGGNNSGVKSANINSRALSFSSPPQSINKQESTATSENSDAASSPGTVNLSVVHLNDFHGAIEPMIDPDVTPTGTVGGAAYVKTVIDREREKDPEGTLVVNAGDIAEGSMIAYLSKGKVVADAFKEMKFDATALGNHDFAWGQEDMKNMVEGLDTPVLAANITRTDTGEVMDGAEPYMIKNMKGVKVGIIGLDTPEIEHFVEKSKLKGLRFNGAAETIRKYLPEVKKKGADIVMVLSHLGTVEDEKLAKEVDGIDIIVGGHSHTALDHGKKVGDTIIVQAGSLGRFVGKLDLEFDPSTKKIVGHSAKLLPVINDEIEPDPGVQKVLAPYLAQAEKYGSEILGEATEDLHYGHREMGKLNQIHADSICEKSGAPFGICNSRSLRGHIKKGEVTRKALYSALPFTEEGFVTMNIQGKYIRGHIEDCLADGATELAVPMGSLKYQYDPSRPSGQRLTSVKLDGKEMDDDKEYFVCLNETMSRQGNFEAAKDKKKVGSSQDEFFEYFTKHGPWDDNTDNRITVVKS